VGAGTNPITASLSTLTLGIINPDHTNGTGKVNDVFSALLTVGDTTTVAQFPVTTLNNRPVSRFVGTTEYFVPQLQSNTVIGTGSSSSTSATAQPITSGITLQMTPRLLEDGRIILQYSLNIQNITEIQCFNTCTGVAAECSSTNSGNSATASGCVIQEPVTTNRSFIQQSVLRSGSLLVIGGIDEEDLAQNANGVGDPFNWLLGGGTSNATGRTMVFIAIAPQVLDPPPAEQGL
jgi:type II secretory pathway component GspD/PulD (secretin)